MAVETSWHSSPAFLCPQTAVVAFSVLTHQALLWLSLSPRQWVVVLALISRSRYPGTQSLSHTASDPNPSRHFPPSQAGRFPSVTHRGPDKRTSRGAGRGRGETEDDEGPSVGIPCRKLHMPTAPMNSDNKPPMQAISSLFAKCGT